MKRLRLSAVAVVTAAYLFVPLTSYGPELRIDVLDIGQGDSILVTTPDHYHLLIDGGPDDTVTDQIDEVLPFWDRTIDIILPSHPQADHITGIADVLGRFKVNHYLDTPALADIAVYKKIKKEIVQYHVPENYFLTGSTVSLDNDITLTSLWPPPTSDWQHVQDLNDVAEVFRLQYGPFTALFTGDAGANIDQKLLQAGQTQHIDVLKVGHHGSKTGTDTAFLQAIHPEISIISVGADNRYGHPAPSTLAQLKSVGSQVWRTDQDGRVEVQVNKAGISVYSTK